MRVRNAFIVLTLFFFALCTRLIADEYPPGPISPPGGGGGGATSCSGLSDAATSCSTDTTNASNITTGTLPDAQLSTNVTLRGSTFDINSASDGTPLSIANGGTGSGTQNFCGLTGDQSIAGVKTFTGNLIIPHNTLANIPLTGAVGNIWQDDTTPGFCFWGATDTPTCFKSLLMPGKIAGSTVTTDVQEIDLGEGLVDDSSTSTALKTKVVAKTIQSGAAPTIAAAGNIGVDTTDDQLKYYGAAVRVLSYKKTYCATVENLTSADDDMMLFSPGTAITVTGVWCHCKGACSPTLATFTLENAAGAAMTITGTNPTCVASTAVATPSAVTANNAVAIGDLVKFSTTNTPTIGDTYQICISYTEDAL